MWRCGDREGDILFLSRMKSENPIRYPIRLSEFKERPKFYLSTKVEQEIQIPTQVIDQYQLAQRARDLNRLAEKSKGRKKEPYMKYKVKNRGRGMSR